MPGPTVYITTDGEPPNGGVVPGRLLMANMQPLEEPPNGGVVPYTQVLNGSPSLQRYQPMTFIPPSQRPVLATANDRLIAFNEAVAQLHLMPTAGFPAFNCVSSGGNQQSAALPVQEHVHYHFIAHASNSGEGQDATQGPPTQHPQTHTWIKFLCNDVRPGLSYPDNATILDWVVPKTTTMRDFLGGSPVPKVEGHGLQQVYRRAMGGWDRGHVFEWGAGSPTRTIGETTLGQGVEGDEAFLRVWGR